MREIKFKFILEYTETKIKKLSRAYVLDEIINYSPLGCIMDDFEEIMTPYIEELDAYIGGEFVVCSEKILFTGLKDKNGVEIYEGDLLRPYYDDNEIVEVIWHEETASYRAASYLNNCHGGCFAELLFFDDVNDIEVIGNIYENGDLLETNP